MNWDSTEKYVCFLYAQKHGFFRIVIERRDDDVVARTAMAEDFADDA